MKKLNILLVLIVIVATVIIPVKVNALTIENFSNDNILNNFVYIGEQYTCEGDNSILGSVNDPNSVAWLLQQVFNMIKVIGPILVVVLSSVEFAKVIIKSDDEAMTKAQKQLVTRIILAACLFFIPTLVDTVLNLFGFTSDATCQLR